MCCRAAVVIVRVAKFEFEAAKQLTVVGKMAVAQLFVCEVHEMPCVVGSICKIVGTLFHRMVATSVKAGLVYKIQCCGVGTGNGNCRVSSMHVSTFRGSLQYRTEMYGVHLVASGMSCYCDLLRRRLCLVRSLSCERHSEIKFSRHA